MARQLSPLPLVSRSPTCLASRTDLQPLEALKTGYEAEGQESLPTGKIAILSDNIYRIAFKLRQEQPGTPAAANSSTESIIRQCVTGSLAEVFISDVQQESSPSDMILPDCNGLSSMSTGTGDSGTLSSSQTRVATASAKATGESECGIERGRGKPVDVSGTRNPWGGASLMVWDGIGLNQCVGPISSGTLALDEEMG